MHVLDQLTAVIDRRRGAAPDASYVASLLAGGVARCGDKVREEAAELIEAAGGGDAKAIAAEAADLLFHALVLLAAADVPATDVWAELERRFGVSGHDEKAARG